MKVFLTDHIVPRYCKRFVKGWLEVLLIGCLYLYVTLIRETLDARGGGDACDTALERLANAFVQHAPCGE